MFLCTGGKMGKRITVLPGVFVVILFMVLLGLCSSGSAASLGYKEVLRKGDLTKIVLDNGLSAVLLENHAAPVVALQVWVNVGSRYEQDEQAGISHVFEHMLFKGTEKRGVGEIAREVETAGGNINAFTSFDHTVYHVTLASRYLDVGLDVLSDAIQHSSFDPDELARESEVVLEELKRSDDDPGRVASRKFFEKAFTLHPYRRPVIGYEDTFTALTREHYLDYFHTWYVPNNMSLIVVGDFETGEVIPRVVEAFRGFAPNPNLSLKVPREPEQRGIRTVVTRQEASHAFLNMGYHIPGIRHPKNPALDMLGTILGQGETSRLYKEVKRKKELVHTLYAYAFTPVDAGIFLVDARLDASNIEAALEEILRQVHRLQVEPVSEEELFRARVNIESDFVYSRQTMQGQARKLGYYESDLGDPLHHETYLKGIASVTPQTIMHLAKAYLTPENLTVSLLLAPDQREDLDENSLKNMIQEISRKIEKESRSVKREEQTLPHKTVLPNGIRLIVKENHSVPTVAVKIAFLGGQRFENEETSGIYNFIAAMMDRGTARRSAEEISAEIEDMAGSVNGFSGRNSFGAELSTLSRHFTKGIQLLADLVLHPAFDPEEIEKVRKDIVAAIKQQEDVLSQRAGNLFRKTLFKTHPYRLRVIGEEETVMGFTHVDLNTKYFQSISPDSMVISIVGDITEKDAVSSVEKLFGGMKNRSIVAPEIPKEVPQEEVRESVEFADRRQAHMILGFLGTTVTSPDRYPLEVLNNVLAGQGGRLFMELRDKKSLAYVVTSFSQEGVDPGYFAAYIGCSPEKLEEGKAGILAELLRIQEEKVPDGEMERSKRNLIGRFDIALQTNDSMASTLVFNELYGNGYDAYLKYSENIEKVTARDVQRIAKKYLDLSRYSLGVVKPPEESVGEEGVEGQDQGISDKD